MQGRWSVLAFVPSAGVDTFTAIAGTIEKDAGLASVHPSGVGSASHCRCLHKHVSALLRTLLAWSTWPQPANVVRVTTGDGAALASVRLLGVGSNCQCGSLQDR
jgi:hypothetical protein